MVIGIVKENREKSEKRVILLPSEVKDLIKSGHSVKVEKNAGSSIKVTNEDYLQTGAMIVTKEEAYSSDMVVRIRIPNISELNLMKSNSILVCMVHRTTHPEMVKEFSRRKITVLELNEVRDNEGKRLIEAFYISGSEGIKTGFALFNKLYKKDPLNVVIMGYGNIAIPAIQTICKLGAVAKVLGRNQTSSTTIRTNLINADILVNATYRQPSEIGEYLVTKENLLLMNRESLVIDLSADPISCIESCRPTSLDQSYYLLDIKQRQVPHLCIYSLPGLKPFECSQRYSKQITPFISLIANKGIQGAIKIMPSLKQAFINP